MKYADEELIIELKGNTIYFTGKMEQSDYVKLRDFLFAAERNVDGDEMILNFFDLDYLNSNGVLVIALLLKQSDKKIVMKIDDDRFWQSVGLKPLRFIKKGRITVTVKEPVEIVVSN